VRRLAGSAFLWLALLLIAGEIGAWWVLPYRRIPKADATIRNPLGHRGWPEYLDVKDGARPLVVLISASQGVAPEIRDKNNIYAAALREHLARAGYRFENWSTRGMRTTELELLVYRAISRRARHVLLLIAVDNFDPPELVNLTYPFSDIVLFSGAPSQWASTRDALFMQHSHVEDVFATFVRLHSNLARSRDAVIDVVAANLSLTTHRFVFGREIRTGDRLDEMADPGFSLLFPADDLPSRELAASRAALYAKPKEWDLGDMDGRLETFSDLTPRLRDRLAGAGVGVTWVWQPVDFGSCSPETRERIARFVERATAVIEAGGEHCHNLIEAIRAERFLTPGHVDELGQKQLAELLIPILDEDVVRARRAP
jgi:hypothetical protein